LFRPQHEAVKAMAEEHIRIFGSAGKAATAAVASAPR
jgi:hypothetical protein